MSTTQASTPVAPVVGSQGSSTPGGHYVAYRAQGAFALDASLKLISGSNPWRPNTPGFRFYTAVLAKSPATVGAAVTLGKDAGFKPREVQNHLRWLYTWGGSYVEIGGKVFSPPVGTAPAPVAKAPAKAPKSPKVKA
jgi:hypothetical protein